MADSRTSPYKTPSAAKVLNFQHSEPRPYQTSFMIALYLESLSPLFLSRRFLGDQWQAVFVNLRFGRSRFLCRYSHPTTRKNRSRVGDPGTRAHIPHFLASLSHGAPSKRALLTLCRNDNS